MKYVVHLKPRALRDLRGLDRSTSRRIYRALEKLRDDLSGDVKRLTDFTLEYRLRVGSYRVLFEIEGSTHVVVYRILHRRDAYRR
ncbi:MAG: type II toxin-antitoxin system RelE/ParE family toxin [Planctomycetota bacterium]